MSCRTNLVSGFAALAMFDAQLQGRPAVEDVLDDLAEALRICVGCCHFFGLVYVRYTCDGNPRKSTCELRKGAVMDAGR